MGHAWARGIVQNCNVLCAMLVIMVIVLIQPVMDLMASSVSDAVQGPVNSAVKGHLIPAYDRSSQLLFQQLNTTFHKGLSDCK